MTETMAIFDSSVLGDALDNDQELITDILDGYLEDMAIRMDELAAAIDSADREAVQRTGHTMKGTSATVGAREASSIAYGIEKAGESGEFEEARRLSVEWSEAFARVRLHLGKEG